MKWKEPLFMLFIVVFLTVFSTFNVGYEPVHSDEITYLSLMKVQEDPSLYSKDLLISDVLPNLPLPFYNLLGLFSFINETYLFFFVYVLTRALLILSVFFLSYTLFKDKLVSYISVISVLLLRGEIGMVIGSYEILNKIPTFSFFIAVPILLFSIAFFLRRKYIISSVLLAISMYLHATTSLFVFLLFCFYFLINYKKINKGVIGSLALFFVIASPILIKSFTATSAAYIPMEQWLYFLNLRVSGHFFPSTWSLLSYSLFAVLVIIFFISFKHKPGKDEHNKIVLISLGTLILICISFFFTEIVPIRQVIQASFLRGIVIFRVIAIIYVVNYVVKSFESKSRTDKIVAQAISLFIILLMALPFFVGEHKGIFNEVNLEKHIGHWEDVALKAKELTPKNSLFITPTFSLGFTFFSERSEFINWKTSGVGVYSSYYVAEAINRFSFVCKHDFNFVSRAELVEECKNGYNNLNEEDLNLAKEKYGVTHIIVEQPKQLNLKLIYENEEYKLYEL